MSESKSTQSKSTLTGTEMANLIGVDPKDFRRFVRSVMRANGAGDALPGSGRRYAFDASEADAWAERYRNHSHKTGRAAVSITDLASSDDASDQ